MRKMLTFFLTGILILAVLVVLTGRLKVFQNVKQFSQTIPNNIGIQVHIGMGSVNPSLIKSDGFGIIRDDILWSRVEHKKNQYDFKNTGYDYNNKRILESGLRAYYVLGYGNPIYEKDHQSIITKKEREAFVKFVNKVTRRYKNQQAIWEIWNEPNDPKYWYPSNNSAENYTHLVKETSKIIKKNDPSGVVVGPAWSQMSSNSYSWLENTFKFGLLNYVDAVSIHPYRSERPETVIKDYQYIRELIKSYSRKKVPIISGEWGYASGYASYGIKLTELKQAEYFVRMLLINLYSKIPISIWFSWRDGNENENNLNQGFGIRRANNFAPKQAVLASKNFSKILSGYQFSTRLNIGSQSDYIFKFINKKGNVIIVFWTVDTTHRVIWSTEAPVRGELKSIFGKKFGNVSGEKFKLKLSNCPKYLIIK